MAGWHGRPNLVAGSERCDGIAVYMPERGDGIAALMKYGMEKVLGKREKRGTLNITENINEPTQSANEGRLSQSR
jgi:hypothetical protein